MPDEFFIFCLLILEENEADGEFSAGFLEAVDSGCSTAFPFRVDQVCAGHEEVWPEVDGDRAELGFRSDRIS